MAASAAKVEYGAPSRISIGGRFFTTVEVKIAGEAEEYKTGGIALDYTKLGLPDNKPELVLIAEGYFVSESNNKVISAILSKEKLILFGGAKEKGIAAELEEAEGKALKGYHGLLLAIGQ